MRSSGMQSLSSATVLMVDDEPNLSSLIRYYLEREGYHVLAAADGRKAVEIVDQSRPADLAVLDLMLPYVDGLYLIRHIRNNPDWRRTPILMLTGRSDEQDVVRAYDSGADDYMTKPFNPRELMARLRRLLQAQPR